MPILGRLGGRTNKQGPISAQKTLPHSAPARGTPCRAAGPTLETFLHRTNAWIFESRSWPLGGRSCAQGYAMTGARTNSADPNHRPIWESRIQGSSDHGRCSKYAVRPRDDLGAHRHDDALG